MPGILQAAAVNRKAWTPPNAQLNLIASSAYCFSDSAGTVPCNEGDGIYVWRDCSGNNRYAVYPNDLNQPILEKDSLGNWCVNCNQSLLSCTASFGWGYFAASVYRTADVFLAGLISSNNNDSMDVRNNGQPGGFGTGWRTVEGNDFVQTGNFYVNGLNTSASNLNVCEKIRGNHGSDYPVTSVQLFCQYGGNRYIEGYVAQIVMGSGSLSSEDETAMDNYLRTIVF